MKHTELLYLDNDKMHWLETDASVIGVEQREDGRVAIYLDQTIFYPQGGGQPYDKGVIKGKGAEFQVEEVRYIEGVVHHIGHFVGSQFEKDERVHLHVDAARRKLNAQLHSAGHLVDMAVAKLELEWMPGKGYHFPDGPYVEYEGEVNPDEKDAIVAKLMKISQALITADLPVTCRFVELAELQKLCRFVPSNIPTNKPTRVVQFDNFAVPCGGTHIKSLKEIEGMTVTKLKKKDKNVRVSYNVSKMETISVA